MVGCLVKSACRLVMNNHFYSFENKIRKQGKRGAIGNKLTERLGKVLMKRHAKTRVKENTTLPEGWKVKGLREVEEENLKLPEG